MGRAYGLGGGGLAGIGVQEQGEALDLQRQAAEMETKREQSNRAIREANRAGNRQLGSAVGTAAGFYAGAEVGSGFGPWGALIGGALGYLAGGAF